MTGPSRVGMIVNMSENNSGGGRRLLRPREGRMVAGVCAGLGAYFKVDVTLVRLAFGITAFIYGLGALAYVIAWALVPEEGEGESIVESFINRRGPDLDLGMRRGQPFDPLGRGEKTDEADVLHSTLLEAVDRGDR